MSWWATELSKIKRITRKLEAGGKPSSWFPPGELVELSADKNIPQQRVLTEKICFRCVKYFFIVVGNLCFHIFGKISQAYQCL